MIHKCILSTFTALHVLVQQLIPHYEHHNISQSKYYRNEFDRHLERIEDYLGSDQYKNACQEASKAALILESNLSSFEKQEPYYNWQEMKALLIQIPKSYCK